MHYATDHVTLTVTLDEFSFFTRGSVGEFIRFGSRQAAQNTQPGDSQTILPDEEHSALPYHCHGYCEPKGRVVATMVSAPDYPAATVYALLRQLVRKFQQQHGGVLESTPTEDAALDFPALREFISNFQDPAAADKVPQIKKELDDTTAVLYKTLDQVLHRGQSLESIMENSNDLSSASMAFYKTSKRSRCCTIL